MRKPTVAFEWRDLHQGQELPPLETPAGARQAPKPGLERWLLVGGAVFLLIAALVTSHRVMHQAEMGLAQINQELAQTAEIEAWTEQRGVTLSPTLPNFPIVQGNQEKVVSVEVQALRHDLAAVTVVTAQNRAEHEPVTYRQLRFYRQTDAGWQPAAPDPTLWGPLRQVETVYFIFTFRQKDAKAVAAVAAEIDTLYATLHSNMGLPMEAAEQKLAVEVSVTLPPGTMPHRVNRDDPILVSSPALYLAPAELADTELLAQALALPLIEHVTLQALQYYAIQQPWTPVMGGLRLWQVWEMDLPLANGKEDVVRWSFGLQYLPEDAESGLLPKHYVDLCAMHHLWLLSPKQIKIPLACDATDYSKWAQSWWSYLKSPVELARLGIPLADGSEWIQDLSPSYPGDSMSHPNQAIALATLLEYMMAAYGREQLPALLAGMRTYASWETLLPVVLGVSAAEFEAGWQAYLTEQYGITVDAE